LDWLSKQACCASCCCQTAVAKHELFNVNTHLANQTALRLHWLQDKLQRKTHNPAQVKPQQKQHRVQPIKKKAAPGAACFVTAVGRSTRLGQSLSQRDGWNDYWNED
jgi:hypothetical protein